MRISGLFSLLTDAVTFTWSQSFISIYTLAVDIIRMVGKEYCAASSKNPVYKIGEPTPLSLSLFCCCSKNKFVYPFLMNEKPISFGARKVFLHFIYNIKTGAYEEERGFNFSLHFFARNDESSHRSKFVQRIQQKQQELCVVCRSWIFIPTSQKAKVVAAVFYKINCKLTWAGKGSRFTSPTDEMVFLRATSPLTLFLVRRRRHRF